MTIAILDARDKEYVVVAAGADLISTYVQQAIAAGETAQAVLDAILAAGLSEGVFPSEAAGLSGTTDGQYFWVGVGGTVTLYLNDSGTGSEIAELATVAGLALKVNTADLEAPTGAGSVGTTDGNVQSDIDARMPLVWARPTGGDDTAALNAAIAALDTSGGKAATLDLSAGGATISGLIDIPSRVTLRGVDPRTTRLTLIGASAKIRFNGTDRAGLQNLRIAADSAVPRLVEVVNADAASTFSLTMRDLEIVGANTNGQQGLYLFTDSGKIITECYLANILIEGCDRPMIDIGSEGNFFMGITMKNFAFTQARSAIEAVSHANTYIGRVAYRFPFAGSVGMTQAGSACDLIKLAVDIGNDCTALNVTGTDNNILLSRPRGLDPDTEELIQTPRGFVDPRNILFDSGEVASQRMAARGQNTPTAGNFNLTGFGDAWEVDLVSGSDQSVALRVKSRGSGQTAYPTIDYTFADGSWPSHPLGLFMARVGGNQLDASGYVNPSITSSGWTFQWNGTPVDGEDYLFRVGLL